MRLILVDNDSAGGVEPWSRAFAESKILYNTCRATYAANLNRILAAASARYVLLLNTDMYFDRVRAMPDANGCLSRRASSVAEWPAAGCSMPTAATPTPPDGFKPCH